MTTKLGYPARSALLPVQAAIYARLDSGLSVPIYDYVDENAPYPYVTVGEATEVDDNTHDTFGREVTHTLHVWSKGRQGFAEVLSIADEITRLLDHDQNELVVAGHRVVSVHLDQILTMRDPDPLIRHAPVRFRVNTEQEAP